LVEFLFSSENVNAPEYILIPHIETPIYFTALVKARYTYGNDSLKSKLHSARTGAGKKHLYLTRPKVKRRKVHAGTVTHQTSATSKQDLANRDTS
jgi:hypothetical protein